MKWMNRGRMSPSMVNGILEPRATLVNVRDLMEYPGGKDKHFRHLLLYAYNRGQNPGDAVEEICSVYGDGVINESTARKWFDVFKSGNPNVDSRRRRGSESDEVSQKNF